MADALRPALFLDRDGIINVDTGYPHRPEELRLTPSAAEGIALANRAGALVIVVTNQSGVARGLFELDAVDRFHAAIRAAIAARADARIDAFYVAPWHPQGSVPAFAIEHEDRKPGAGMLRRALRDHPIDPARSLMIGDKPSDAEAARGAGIAARLLPSDHGDLAAAVREWLAAIGSPTERPEAMATLFDDGGGDPTRVVVPRALVARATGVDAPDAAQFAAWIDAEGDRLFRSARALRARRTGLEEIVLQPADLLPDAPVPSPASPAIPMVGDSDPPSEARVVALGEAVEDVDPLFLGTLAEALDYVAAHDAAWRRQVCIWTEGRIYGSDEFAALAARSTRL